MKQALHRIYLVHSHLCPSTASSSELMWDYCSNIAKHHKPEFNAVKNVGEGNQQHYVLSEEVKRALEAEGPVVALESTVLTHGLPWPTNRMVAHLLEEVVRQHHATPATIAVDHL
jgi:hypothetical protein